MDKFNIGDKVFVEGVYSGEYGGNGGREVLFVNKGLQTFVGNAPIHKAIPQPLCGQWVNYNGEKWWCVGKNAGRMYLITSDDNIGKCIKANYCSEDEYEENLMRIVVIEELSLWQEPKECEHNYLMTFEDNQPTGTFKCKHCGVERPEKQKTITVKDSNGVKYELTEVV